MKIVKQANSERLQSGMKEGDWPTSCLADVPDMHMSV
jgi:hypothetical protein